jgi:hypothetical protein
MDPWVSQWFVQSWVRGGIFRRSETSHSVRVVFLKDQVYEANVPTE